MRHAYKIGYEHNIVAERDGDHVNIKVFSLSNETHTFKVPLNAGGLDILSALEENEKELDTLAKLYNRIVENQ